MDNKLEAMIIECAKDSKKRKDLFYQIGQEFLLPLKDRELEEKTFEVFQLILKHEKQWKGDLLVPEYYRYNKNEHIFKDIWYTLRDFFSWSVLYPKEVDTYFQHDKNGTVGILANPKVRIIDKDNAKQVTKTEAGKSVVVQVKKERTFQIDSGFILAQKDSILNICIAGLLELPPGYKPKAEKVVKKSKKETVKEDAKKEIQEKTIINEKEESLEDKVKPEKVVKKSTKKTVKEPEQKETQEKTIINEKEESLEDKVKPKKLAKKSTNKKE